MYTMKSIMGEVYSNLIDDCGFDQETKDSMKRKIISLVNSENVDDYVMGVGQLVFSVTGNATAHRMGKLTNMLFIGILSVEHGKGSGNQESIVNAFNLKLHDGISIETYIEYIKYCFHRDFAQSVLSKDKLGSIARSGCGEIFNSTSYIEYLETL